MFLYYHVIIVTSYLRIRLNISLLGRIIDFFKNSLYKKKIFKTNFPVEYTIGI